MWAKKIDEEEFYMIGIETVKTQIQIVDFIFYVIEKVVKVCMVYDADLFYSNLFIFVVHVYFGRTLNTCVLQTQYSK